jgi:TolB-like protein/DNA-binding winged helix-turn-helix (wHTH) protein/Tfp pilus assembly protein PilF
MAESPRLSRVLRFGLYEADLDAAELRRNGLKVRLQDRPFEILKILLERPGEVITREEFRQRLWPADTFVDFDHSLNGSINKLRQALDDEADNPRFVATAGRRGYRFIAPVGGSGHLVAENATEPLAPEATVRAAKQSSPDNPQTRRGASRRILWVAGSVMIVLVLATFSAGWRYLHRRPQTPPRRIMLAVLPFQNLTGDPEQEYFADGLTEELITQLGRLHPEQLGVIARTSVMGYKRSDKRVDQIARDLSVQYVLEGSVRRTPDRLRITAQLIAVADQSHLWAQVYDRNPQDVLTVEDDVALAVANEIQVQLSPHQQTDLARGRTVNPEAYEAYLKGRYFWNKRTPDGLKRSADYFQVAIAKDPNYALAYAGLADAYVLLGGYGVIPQKDAMPKAKVAAQQALAIDDRLAEAYTSLGLIVEQYEWNWTEGGRDYRRAIELNPNYSVAHHFYADGHLAAMGKTDEAIAELQKAHELDPLSPIIASDLGRHLCNAGRYDEAIAQFRKILEVDPDFALAHDYLSQVYEREALYPEAIAEMQKIKTVDSAPYTRAQLAHIYALAGRKREALQILDELKQTSKRTYVDPWTIAYIYVALKKKDLTFFWLEKAYAVRSPGMGGLKFDPYWDKIRGDPRFQSLLRRVGFSDD